jgi:hypothetical protein
MKRSLVIEGLRSDVVAVGELGDDTVAQVAERIAGVLARSAQSRILDLLSDVAAELSAELPEGRVEIRLVGDDVEFAYVDEQPAASSDEVGGAAMGSGDLSSRITLRLPEQLKARVEASAGSEGVSVNGWIIRVLERGTSAVSSRSSRGGSRLHGYGTS